MPPEPKNPTGPTITNLSPNYNAVQGATADNIKPKIINVDEIDTSSLIWELNPATNGLKINGNTGEITGEIDFKSETQITFTIIVSVKPSGPEKKVLAKEGFTVKKAAPASEPASEPKKKSASKPASEPALVRTQSTQEQLSPNDTLKIYNAYMNKNFDGPITNKEEQEIYIAFKEKTISLQLKDLDNVEYEGLNYIIKKIYDIELNTLNRVIDKVILKNYLSINDRKIKLNPKPNIVKKVKITLKNMYYYINKVYLYGKNLKSGGALETKIENYMTTTKINEIQALGAESLRFRPFDFFTEARTISTPTKRYDDERIKVIVDVILLLNKAIYDFVPSMSWEDRLSMASYLGRGYAYEEIGVSKTVNTETIKNDLLENLQSDKLSDLITSF